MTTLHSWVPCRVQYGTPVGHSTIFTVFSCLTGVQMCFGHELDNGSTAPALRQPPDMDDVT